MNLTMIISFCYWILVFINLINILNGNILQGITNILIIILIDKNIRKNLAKYTLVCYDILCDLLILNIQTIFWVGIFGMIFYFIISM